MIADKPNPEELDTFLKNLTDQELNELIVTRAHQHNTVPIEFVSHSQGVGCGIDNDGYQLAIVEAGNRANKHFDWIKGELTKRSRAPGTPVDTLSLLKLNHLASGHRPFSGRDYPVTTRLDDVNPITLLRDREMPIGAGGRDARPLVWLDDQQKGRQVSATERFEKFVKEIPIHELFQLGDLIVDNPVARGLGDYHSLALEQSETVYHTDLPLIYGEIKSRFKQMGIVK